ncbi:helix-turn-helix domain-containing protein, partial [Salmonella enterica]|uniref:helix-turn-helix domain-containing protein n=1 Tax=Salmonella enterica TaxID=28901 RepID=UPI0021161440
MTEVRRRGRPGQAEPTAQKGAQALERGIAILQYLERSGGSSSVSDISGSLDLPLSTTFRLLKVLQAADFVYQDSQLGWWHIGLGPRFYVSTSKSIIKALINMHSFEIQL